MIADHPSFHLTPGTTPLLVSLPHCGELIPDELRSRYHPRALNVEDTDWHLHRLYAFAAEMGASVLQPRASRFVIDLNRPSDNAPMYPGANNTELCPTRFFTGDPIYVDGGAPTPAEITPAHRAVVAAVPRRDRHRARAPEAAHGHAVIFDGHSIKSELPWLFEGRLPALNLGTVDGAAARPRCATSWPACSPRRTAIRTWSTAASRAATSRATTAGPTSHPRGAARDDLGLLHGRDAAVRVPPRQGREVQPLLRELLRTMRDWTPR
jgi:N-formylglutamate deformylase